MTIRTLDWYNFMFLTIPLDDHTHGDILDSDTRTYDNIYDIKFDFIQTNNLFIWRYLKNENSMNLTLAPLGMEASLWGSKNKKADHVLSHWAMETMWKTEKKTDKTRNIYKPNWLKRTTILRDSYLTKWFIYGSRKLRPYGLHLELQIPTTTTHTCIIQK